VTQGAKWKKKQVKNMEKKWSGKEKQKRNRNIMQGKKQQTLK